MNNIMNNPTRTKENIDDNEELSGEVILIKNSVGSQSIIEATALQIDGITQKDSTQFTRYGKINIHKGLLRCHDAKIKHLDGGEVHATKVSIEYCTGGSIYAQDVEIKEVTNSVKIYALHSIKIDYVSGQDNLFKINYRDIPIVNSKLDLITEDIDQLQYKLKLAIKHDKFKASELNNQISQLKNKKISIFNAYKNAKISIKHPMTSSNTIIFTIDDKTEILFKTKAEIYTPFYLEITNEAITLLPVNQTIILSNTI